VSRQWEADSKYTQINYSSCKNANLQSIEDGHGPIPEWDNNNRARESFTGSLGLLTGHFPDYAKEDDEDEELNAEDAFLTQAEAIVMTQLPPWIDPQGPG
jgi:hypothetical protein